MELLGIAGVASVTIICYIIGLLVKASGIDNKWIPIVCGLSGGALGCVALMIGADAFPAHDYLTAVAVGIVSGLASTGADQVVKQMGVR